MTERPNIILCTCDQLRAFETGCYGNEFIVTPNIDRLASEGVRFEQAVTNFPVCMAARSVLLSGQCNRTCTGGIANVEFTSFEGNHELPEYPFPGRPHLKDTTLPEMLQAAGYDTAVIGKWHIHSWPHDIGFDYYLIPRVHHCHTGQHYTENGDPEFVPSGYSVDFEADRVESFFKEKTDQEKPFFLYYNISPPHCPMSDAPERYTTMYDPEAVPLRENVNPELRLKNQDHWFKVYCWDFRYYKFHLPYTEKLPQNFTIRDVTALYYGMTTWVDDTVGRMLAALESAGLAENTIVIFTSDYGDNLGSHGMVQKNTPNEESLRVPYIIRWPAKLATNKVDHTNVISHVDIMPTLLSLLDYPIPDHIDGRDFKSMLKDVGGSSDTNSHAYFETSEGAGIRTTDRLCFIPYDDAHSAKEIRSNTRKLAETPAQFYNLTNDPYEQDNLAGADREQEEQTRLIRMVHDWNKHVPWMHQSK